MLINANKEKTALKDKNILWRNILVSYH